ncbi:methyl-accepting chemotaxis protein [Microbacterium testaceum StLB037]|uniref:Methyl-accepting chemotaxis protein n=1 Tax=Microbacterium testaceum (strain StLB037) TaxID=979556 RepID=E8N9T8_MICTS|nr:hypothetical protein [Microbacterium testaceum]BAJ74557.1 methyl-accepting chemotaxis protein [Microbacterium testaceum StLB037]
MPTWALFEEKEFETLANAAFVTEQVVKKRNVRIFSPGQVLEKSLAFDFATHVGPHTRLYRRLFGSAPGAPGASAGQLAQFQIPVVPSTRFLNVFLQYKRPEYFQREHRSQLWPKNEEFLRFTVSENYVSGGGYHFDQISALDDLAGSFGSNAVVRYACPSVWSKADLYGLFSAQRLLDTSVFVAPEKLRDVGGGDPYHRRWTFQRGSGKVGVPNPNGPLTQAEDGELFFDHAEAVAKQPRRSASYVEDLIGEASSVQKVRVTADARKGKLSKKERSRTDIEDRALESDLKRVPQDESDAVRASLELATIARDLGVQWSVIAFE